MKIKINDIEHELNVESALRAGYLKVAAPSVIKAGDVFNSRQDLQGFNLIVLQQADGKFVFAHRRGNPFELWEDVARTQKELQEWAKSGGWTYSGHITLNIPERGPLKNLSINS